ncbi:MAG: hypothetical protein ACOX8X_03970 [Methanomethylophilus sp.]|jgi:bacterioferritin-associated ferredoxin
MRSAQKAKRPVPKSLLARKKDGGEVPGTAVYDPCGILKIRCRGCDQFPDAGSPACVRCIASAISSEGAAERIWLEGGKDTEIHGPAAEILCNLAQLKMVNVPNGGGKRCASCPRSPARIIGDAWADFPDPSFASACDRLYSASDDGPECATCLQRTRSALLMADGSMRKVKAKAARLASGRRDGN